MQMVKKNKRVFRSAVVDPCPPVSAPEKIEQKTMAYEIWPDEMHYCASFCLMHAIKPITLLPNKTPSQVILSLLYNTFTLQTFELDSRC